MIHLAVVGSGPAGCYTAEAAQNRRGDGVRVDIIDRLPVPYGIIRAGSPVDRGGGETLRIRCDFRRCPLRRRRPARSRSRCKRGALHVSRRGPGHRRFADRPLGIPGAYRPGVIGSAAFVGWYDGHPDFAHLAPPLVGEHAVVIGNGNVALDVARILAKTPGEFVGSDIVAHAFEALGNAKQKTITIVGRRGPHQIAMTPKELDELAHLERALVSVDPAALCSTP